LDLLKNLSKMKISLLLICLGIIIGFLFILLGILFGIHEGKGKAEVKYAVGGVLGFIPFGFANDRKLLIAVLLVSTAIFVSWLIFTVLFYMK